jgi:hypothetical protein
MLHCLPRLANAKPTNIDNTNSMPSPTPAQYKAFLIWRYLASHHLTAGGAIESRVNWHRNRK